MTINRFTFYFIAFLFMAIFIAACSTPERRACKNIVQFSDQSVEACESRLEELQSTCSTSYDAVITCLGDAHDEVSATSCGLICLRDAFATGLAAAQTNADLSQDSEKINDLEYRRNISVDILEAKSVETYEGTFPGLRVRIRNNGDRTVTRLALRVEWTANGSAVSETNMVIVSSDSRFGGTPPLRPGYVTDSPERDRYHVNRNLSTSVWGRGGVRVYVSEVILEN